MVVTECDDCPGGYYCLQEGLTEPSGLCGEGEINIQSEMGIDVKILLIM